MNSVILLHCTQPFLLYCSVILWFIYSELSHFTILNSVILLQCLIMLWFCYSELGHFCCSAQLFLTSAQPFLVNTVLSHCLIAIVHSHFLLLQYSIIFLLLHYYSTGRSRLGRGRHVCRRRLTARLLARAGLSHTGRAQGGEQDTMAQSVWLTGGSRWWTTGSSP
jgi:hypothetical protein